MSKAKIRKEFIEKNTNPNTVIMPVKFEVVSPIKIAFKCRLLKHKMIADNVDTALGRLPPVLHNHLYNELNKIVKGIGVEISEDLSLLAIQLEGDDVSDCVDYLNSEESKITIFKGPVKIKTYAELTKPLHSVLELIEVVMVSPNILESIAKATSLEVFKVLMERLANNRILDFDDPILEEFYDKANEN